METWSDTASWDITFNSLSVGYGEHVVLEDITATLPGGKISVILGGSGCGKSTLLRHIIGLSRPLAGSLCIAGLDPATLVTRDFRRLRRQIGVLFQDGALLGAMTLAQNVALPLSEHLSLPRTLVRGEALRVLKMVELEDFADFYPHQLSGGMRKRAGLARAIIANPRILLCDEPTSGLDPVTAARMDDLLLSLHAQFPSMTIVSVSHDLMSLERIADYVLVLKDGHLHFAGDLASLKASRDPYLTMFLSRDAGTGMRDFSESMDAEVAAALERSFRA
ncbi:MAG: ATP-binding cassette domain-containing protein [Desulfovibrio sp.]|nr:ATP-binding cassette domain-containing protein [Desulfovibrio sp.]